MLLEAGSIVEGRVTGITKFGAFVELPGGKTGMVHISEVASTYVREIKDFITENQTVTVKVLAISVEGKISLSIKRANEPQQTGKFSGPVRGIAGAATEVPTKQSFEEMLNKFKQVSDDRISDLKRNIEGKRKTAKRSHKA
jgi:S1 RNA binding domain protein